MSDGPGINALGGNLVWMGTQPPMSPEEATNALVGATGVPDIRAGVNALTRGEILPGIGQTGMGLAQLGSLAYPAGRMVGRVLGEAIPAIPRVLGDVSGAFTAYHGTPHTFEPVEGNPFGQFTDEAIGTGEGAQAYGWGHYVAGSPKTAETYQAGAESGTGNLLEVHVLPHEHELLDWDKPLSEQTPEIHAKIDKFWKDNGYFTGGTPASQTNQLADNFYNDISRDLASERFSDGSANASKALHEAGIPGIKYLDAGSRNQTAGMTYTGSENKIPRFVNNFGQNVNSYEEMLDEANRQIQYNSTRADQAAERYEKTQAKKMWPESSSMEEAMFRSNLPDMIQSRDFIVNNKDKFEYKDPRTYNYVIFDPSNLRIVARNGQRLEPVDHNPFQTPTEALAAKARELEDMRLTREGLIPDEFDRPNFFQNKLGGNQ